jgi:beta-lactam-binding protein with PASTA domain
MSTTLRRSHPVRGLANRSARASSWSSAIVIAISTIIFAIIVMAVAQFINQIPRPTLNVGLTIPQLVGLPLTVAEDRAVSTELSVQVLGERPSDQYPRGVVVQQSPVSGWHVNEAREVRVTVSSGLVVPDVVGQTRSEAELSLARLNWTPVSIDSAPEARVRLQYPPPGVPVNAPGQMSLAYEGQDTAAAD